MHRKLTVSYATYMHRLTAYATYMHRLTVSYATELATWVNIILLKTAGYLNAIIYYGHGSGK